LEQTDPFRDILRRWLEVFMRRSMRNFFQFAKGNDLSMSQIYTLFHLHRIGAGNVSYIGKELGVTNAAASQMVERLLQQALILRFEDPDDRRNKQIVLTDKAQRILRDSILARQSWVEDLAMILSLEEKGQISAALQIMIDKAKYLDEISEVQI
jgi:DNA-binding MarR family transcriptional regulator